MSIELETSATIDRPVEEVFEYVTSVEHNEEWEPRMVHSPPPNGEMAVGTTWRPEIEGLRGTDETTMECIVYDPPTEFGYTTPDGMLGGRLKTEEAIFTLSGEAESTRVDWAGEDRRERSLSAPTAGARPQPPVGCRDHAREPEVGPRGGRRLTWLRRTARGAGTGRAPPNASSPSGTRRGSGAIDGEGASRP